MTTLLNRLPFIIILCLTLGLAPFFPEPHIIGKIRWIAGGAEGMGAIDYFDFLFHAFPWVLLLRWIILRVLASYKKA